MSLISENNLLFLEILAMIILRHHCINLTKDFTMNTRASPIQLFTFVIIFCSLETRNLIKIRDQGMLSKIQKLRPLITSYKY